MNTTAPTTGVGVGRLDLVVLDCPDPRGLAAFYSTLLGWAVTRGDSSEWIELRGPGGTGLAFQLAPNHVPPSWPDGAVPQQLHLDIDVASIDAAEAAVLAAGATATGLPDQTAGGPDSFRVYLDPAGHPFCLCQAAG
ncbi:VOC family protein [Pengzhenrongella sp.]|jgi:predicted enzyme related to lactoylglutathione lyase|uniref:VOC family protein n=1 Tax=Pengzhenrongella sp. TaxID=2888820 RepID=UPI002F957BFB